MLSPQNIESELSYAYLHAVASRAGVICECAGRHSDNIGIDAKLHFKGRLAADSVFLDFSVDVQLKATAKQPSKGDGKYSYSLKLKNYDELRETKIAGNKLLVVFFLPREPERWLSHSTKELISRRCAYWLSLWDAPESDNATAQTVYIPCANELSVEGLTYLLTRFSRQERIPYET